MRQGEYFLVLSKILCDSVAIFFSLLLAYFVRMEWFDFFSLSSPNTLFPFTTFFTVSLQITLFLMFIMILHGRYHFGQEDKGKKEYIELFWAFSAGMGLLLVFFYFTQATFFSRIVFGLSWVLGIAFILFGRVLIYSFQVYCRRYFWGKKRVLVLGNGQISHEIIQCLKADKSVYIVGILSGNNTKKSSPKILGTLEDFESIIQQKKIDEVIFATEEFSEIHMEEYIRISSIHNVVFKLVPNELSMHLSDVYIKNIGQIPIFELPITRIRGWGYISKNVFDTLLAVFLLILLLPLILVIMIVLFVSDPKSPVFYRSARVGRFQKIFWCFKFRTMVVDAEKQKKKLLKQNDRQDGILFKMKNDPRITVIGKFLRRWSLDEIPQLLNVLKGEMSFIGPRPHLQEEVEKYPKQALYILMIKPGMSGYAQVNGRSGLSFDEEMRYELYYLKYWSYLLDIKIFFKTFTTIIQGNNSH